ncbi:hypothetical protein QQZ08_003258 [Neonectria magnoliae]|uniref:Uncharacterized protein n=1 Tax=Neonectria magnoliae TaxID=2732573 RepID=A0ABR1I9K5_9HYPO
MIGFDPSVTTKTPEEIIEEWHEFADLCLNRPTREEYIATRCYAKGMYSYSQSLTTLTKDRVVLTPNTLPDDIRGAFFGWQPYGENIAELVAADGYKSLESFAVADPEAWTTMSAAISIYDFARHAFRDPPTGSVFLVLNPECTTHEVREEDRIAADREKYALDRAIIVMTDLHRECGTTPPFWGRSQYDGTCYENKSTFVRTMERLYSKPTVALVRSLPHIEGLEEMIDELEPFKDITNRPFAQTAVNGLFMLLVRIFNRRESIEVLHFMNTPMLDCRMVAIILRSCPKVTMLGIYDCPMIGFGDVICLLDLIHEINQVREARGWPKIDKFDFFPQFKFGTPYSTSTSSTYGITWSGTNGEVAQRGIFRIVLEANLKAREMGLKLLFDEDKAFRKYLSQLPLLPLAVESFLDGIHRYCQATETDQALSTGSNRFDVREAMYDVLKAVRLGMENIRHDWPDWYGHHMGKYMVFCSSCGYEMPEEFFIMLVRPNLPHRRVCAGCMLRKTMETEDEHQKLEAFDALTTLFDDWKENDFNLDAPLPLAAEGLFKLRTTDTVRPEPPPMYINADGILYQPQFEHAFVRDNKYSRDSLQSLPSLSRLLDLDFEVKREAVMVRAVCSDVNRLATQLLTAFYPKRTGKLPALGNIRADGGNPSHMDERQAAQPGPLYFGFENAKVVFERVEKLGF